MSHTYGAMRPSVAARDAPASETSWSPNWTSPAASFTVGSVVTDESLTTEGKTFLK